MFVGEIGLSRREYLYHMRYYELLLIHRGYLRRHRDMWSATRWQTYNIMSCSMKDITAGGIYSPRDLLQFPWEKSHVKGSGNQPTLDDVKEMRRQMQEYNEQLAQQQPSKTTQQ